MNGELRVFFAGMTGLQHRLFLPTPRQGFPLHAVYNCTFEIHAKKGHSQYISIPTLVYLYSVQTVRHVQLKKVLHCLYLYTFVCTDVQTGFTGLQKVAISKNKYDSYT